MGNAEFLPDPRFGIEDGQLGRDVVGLEVDDKSSIRGISAGGDFDPAWEHRIDNDPIANAVDDPKPEPGLIPSALDHPSRRAERFQSRAHRFDRGHDHLRHRDDSPIRQQDKVILAGRIAHDHRAGWW